MLQVKGWPIARPGLCPFIGLWASVGCLKSLLTSGLINRVLANGLRLSGSRTCRTVDTLMISRFHGKLEKSWTMIASFLVRKSSPQLYALLILHKKLLFPRSLKHEWFKTQLEEKVLKSASFLGLIIELKRQKKKILIFKSFFIINPEPLSLQVLYYSSYPT